MKFDFTKEPGKYLDNRYKEMNEMPLISVITPYYNAGKYFEQTYNSIMNQTFPYFEWIIVNDGSTNKEDVDILNSFENRDSRIQIINQENGGAVKARKNGVRNSSSEIIVFIDADDLIEKQYLEYIYFALLLNPQATWAYTDSVGFNEVEYLWNKDFSSETMKVENILSYIAGIRKSVFLDETLYEDETRNTWEDWQLWLKLLAKGHYPVHIKQNMFWYRRLSSGALSKIEADPELKRSLEKKIEVLAKNVPDGIRAITFDDQRGRAFEKVKKWEWSRQLPFKKEKIRILMLLPHMERGGADKFNLDIVSNIDKEKYEIGIITTVPAQSEWKQKFAEHVSDIFELPTFLNISDWASFIHYYIKSRQVDVVFNISSYFGYYTLPWLRKEFPHLGIIDGVHAEGKYWRAGGYPRASVALDKILDKTFITNAFTRDIMVNKYGKEKAKTQVIYTGVDENYFNPDIIDRNVLRKELGIEENRPVVIYLCRIAAEKRPFLMLEIAKQTRKKQKDICFLVVGDGPQIEELKDKVKSESLEDTVYIVGAQKDIRPYYAASDISLICSLKEGLAITTFEAMLMKKPVVSANVGGQKELVDQMTGRLVECMQDEEKDFDKRVFNAEEVKGYVDAICELISDKEKLSIMGEACRNRILDGYTLGDLIRTLENEFKQLKQEANSVERIKVSNMLRELGDLTEDYLMMYTMYESKDIEATLIWQAREMYRQLYENEQNKNTESTQLKIQDIVPLVAGESMAEQRLNEIYNMRSWKMIQRYRHFMDYSVMGKVLRKLRDAILPRK